MLQNKTTWNKLLHNSKAYFRRRAEARRAEIISGMQRNVNLSGQAIVESLLNLSFQR